MCSKKEQGQTIIEVLVALTTAVVVVSAITTSVITGLRNAEYSKTQNTATRYAQEGMEFIRFMRDSNYPLFAGYNSFPSQYCLGKGSTRLELNTNNDYPCTDSDDSIDDVFSRIIEFRDDDPYCAPLPPPSIAPATPAPTIANTAKKVTVIVAWTDSKCPNSIRCHESKLVSCLSDYTLVPTIGNIPTPTPIL